MINLQKTSGLPIGVDENYKLSMAPSVKQTGPYFARRFSEMVPVLFDKDAKISAAETYFGYRGLCLTNHENLVNEYHLTYDITITPAIMLGSEYNKTVGHYHANIPGMEIAHPELYEVLYGHGWFVLQKMDSEFKNVLDIVVVEGKAGDKIIYPPNYGHIMVNTGSEPLITANWVSTDTKSLYDPVKEKRGMAIYVIKGEGGKPQIIKNEMYADQPEVRRKSATDLAKFGLDPVEPMYISGMNNPEKLEFLSHPEKYLNVLN